MTKRLTNEQKNQITNSFVSGKTINDLSIEFNCTNVTITRNLKKDLGEKKYKEVFSKYKLINQTLNDQISFRSVDNKNDLNTKKKDITLDTKNSVENLEEQFFSVSPFLEITPLDCEIENANQKDLSSVHISEVDFPQIVYMIVDKNIELNIKYLRDYPDWQFMSHDELNKKTIEIYLDIQIAKRVCKKEQKVIKVPNTKVFKIVAPLLLKKGISRIVSADKLIAL